MPSNPSGSRWWWPRRSATPAKPILRYDPQFVGSFTDVITVSLKMWREAYPNATSANIKGRTDITDDDFQYLKGIKYLNMELCDKITDAAFVHLNGIEELIMNFCRQHTITDAAFVNLQGIKRLDMVYCDQPTITDAAFVNLSGITNLNMGYCDQRTITDAAFINLSGIRTLNMKHCYQSTISGRTLNRLGTNLQILNIKGCNQETINNAKLFFGVTPRDDFVAYYHTSLQNLRTEGDVNNPTNPNSPNELLYTGINDPDLLAENNMQSPERIGMDPVNPTRGGRKIRKYRTRRYKPSKKIKNKRTSRRSKFFQN
jgi:hypothetical protein